MRFNLDNYIYKNKKGYLKNAKGGIFVDAGGDMVRPIKGDDEPVNLEEISKAEFINTLLNG